MEAEERRTEYVLLHSLWSAEAELPGEITFSLGFISIRSPPVCFVFCQLLLVIENIHLVWTLAFTHDHQLNGFVSASHHYFM